MIYENQAEVRTLIVLDATGNADPFAQVGAALRKVIPSIVEREELFITSKVRYYLSRVRTPLNSHLRSGTLPTNLLRLRKSWIRHWNSLGSITLIFIARVVHLCFCVSLCAQSLVIHWPVAFAPANELLPQDPERPGYIKFDLETTLTETWAAMIALPNSKVFVNLSSFYEMSSTWTALFHCRFDLSVYLTSE